MLSKLKFFGLGFLAAVCGTIFAQTQILDLDVLGALDVTSDAPQSFITETDAAADNGIWLQRAVAEQFLFEACTDALSCVDIMQVDRTGSTVDTVNFLPTNLEHNGVAVGGGAVQTSGTFEAVWTDACTTSPSQTWDYVKIGDIVTLRMVDGVSCTGDSTSFQTASGDAPSEIRPASPIIARMSTVSAQDAGVQVAACLQIDFLGGLQYAQGDDALPCNTVAWTASGSRVITSGTGPTMFTYLLIDPS